MLSFAQRAFRQCKVSPILRIEAIDYFGDFSFFPNVGQSSSSFATKSLLEKKGITSLLLLLLFSLSIAPPPLLVTSSKPEKLRLTPPKRGALHAHTHTTISRILRRRKILCKYEILLRPPFLSDPVILLLEEEGREMV